MRFPDAYADQDPGRGFLFVMVDVMIKIIILMEGMDDKMAWEFSFQFIIPDRRRLGIDSSEWSLGLTNKDNKVIMRPYNMDHLISNSNHFVVTGEGYSTEDEAKNTGRIYQDLLIMVFAENQTGANFGRFLTYISTPSNCPKDINKICELSTHYSFEQEDNNSGTAVVKVDAFGRGARNIPQNKLSSSFDKFSLQQITLTDKERLAYDLYSISFFEILTESRFLMLVIAIETLIKRAPRTQAAIDHIDKLITYTEGPNLSDDEKETIKKSLDDLKKDTNEKVALDHIDHLITFTEGPMISNSEVESIKNSLEYLKKDSIKQAGKKLSRNLVGKYNNISPEDFFSKCYDVRSNLVHSNDEFPSSSDIGKLIPFLEFFASDLLTYKFSLHIKPQVQPVVNRI